MRKLLATYLKQDEKSTFTGLIVVFTCRDEDNDKQNLSKYNKYKNQVL